MNRHLLSFPPGLALLTLLCALGLAQVNCRTQDAPPPTDPAPSVSPSPPPSAPEPTPEPEPATPTETVPAADTPSRPTPAPTAEAAAGWSFSGGGSEAPPAEPEELTAEERARYTEVARKLVIAINAEDNETYRSLHTEEGWKSAIPWWRDLFAVQTARFGTITRAYAPTRKTIRFGSMGFRGGEGKMATFVIRFEDPMGGALSFALDDEGKITATNVFIKGELAHYEPKGPDDLIYEGSD